MGSWFQLYIITITVLHYTHTHTYIDQAWSAHNQLYIMIIHALYYIYIIIYIVIQSCTCVCRELRIPNHDMGSEDSQEIADMLRESRTSTRAPTSATPTPTAVPSRATSPSRSQACIHSMGRACGFSLATCGWAKLYRSSTCQTNPVSGLRERMENIRPSFAGSI